MRKTFYIIRHGKQIKRAGDPPLSDTGIQQAIKTANYLSLIPIIRIVSSPLLRTKQTANYIARTLNLTVETNNLLRERFNWGDIYNQSFEDFQAMWAKSSQERDWKLPTGDSSISSGQRMEYVINRLSSDKDECFALVTHGGITTDFLKNVFNHKNLHEDMIKECSITIVQKNTDKSKLDLIQLAYTDHLQKLNEIRVAITLQ